MQGNPRILDQLQRVLDYGLAAIDQYFVHARVYEIWGYPQLGARLDQACTAERTHVARLIQRLLFLEGSPRISPREELRVGGTVPEMLANDLHIKYETIEALRAAIGVCELERDYQTRGLLQRMLIDTEEDQARWLEQQIGLIQQLGLPVYLLSQMQGSRT